DLFVELGHLSVSQFMPSVVEASLEARARVPIESGAAADSSTTLLMTRAPHPPFGHLLPAQRGEGELGVLPLAPRKRGEGGRRPGEGRVINASTTRFAPLPTRDELRITSTTLGINQKRSSHTSPPTPTIPSSRSARSGRARRGSSRDRRAAARRGTADAEHRY